MSLHLILDPSSEMTSELSTGSYDYEYALRYASFTMKHNLHKVEKVHSRTLSSMFLVRQAEYRTRGYGDCVKTLVHVTGASNISSILRGNLDWRRVTRGKFGNGVSFSNDANYANKYAARAIGSERAMIVADVLVGRTSHCCGGSVPPINVDTTTGNNHVYVKYYDDEFLPKYVIYYTDDTPIPVRRFRYHMW